MKWTIDCGEIEKYLNDNYVPCNVYQYEHLPVCVVEIHWGDWKHQHKRCDWLMEEKYKATLLKVEETEENGSDCYSANRYYYVGEE